LFEQTFKNIDDILHKDAGCGSELDYVENEMYKLTPKNVKELTCDKASKYKIETINVENK
jgi:type I restriction enzyme M protein